MKNWLLILVGLALACGAPAEGEWVEGDSFPIGQTGQEIFMPTNYGTENGTAARVCSPPWDGSICHVPDNKFILIGFQAGTCSTWYQTRVFNGHATWQFWINNLGDDWQTATGNNYQIKCGTIPVLPDGTRALGAFQENTADVETHPTEFGTLMQYRKGTVVIDPQGIAMSPGWNNLSEATKQKVVENVVKHELGHVVGFGHESGNTLMGNSANFAGAVYSYDSSMTSRAQCYNEDSGTSDDC